MIFLIMLYSLIRYSQNLMTSFLIYVFWASCEPETVLPVMQMKQKQFYACILYKKNINQQRIIVKFWLNWRNYESVPWSVSYSFSCTKTLRILFSLNVFEQKITFCSTVSRKFARYSVKNGHLLLQPLYELWDIMTSTSKQQKNGILLLSIETPSLQQKGRIRISGILLSILITYPSLVLDCNL